MNHISWQRWAATFAILLVLSFLADYFFLHLLFDPSKRALHRNGDGSAIAGEATTSEGQKAESGSAPSAAGVSANEATTGAGAPPAGQDNFLQTLQQCHDEVSSQGITTPEALMNYLDRSIGKESESIEIENYIFTLPDGSERRIHLAQADNTNSKDKRELRFFGVDAEGYPQRIELTPEQKSMPLEDLKKSLLAQGELREHQVKSSVNLRDGSFLSVETHNKNVYEFQWRGNNPEDHTLSCRNRSCLCK